MYKIWNENKFTQKLLDLKCINENNDSNEQTVDKTIVYTIPNIECQWQTMISPYFDEQLKDLSNENSLKLIDINNNSELMSHFKSSCAGSWSAYAYPLATKQRTINLVNLAYYLFLIDDLEECGWSDMFDDMEKSYRYWSEFEQIFDTRDISEMRPLFRETRKIIERISLDLSEKQTQIIKDLLINWGTSNKFKISTNKDCAQLDPKTFVEFRKFNTGSYFAIFLVEYAMDIDLSDFERNHKLMSDFIEAALNQFSYVNDLYSFRKEYIEDNGDLNRMTNIMATLMNYHKLNANNAVVMVKAKIDEYSNECEQIKLKILADNELNSESVRKLINGVQYYLSGNLVWHKTQPRYHGTDFKGDITNTTFTLSPK